MSHKTETMKKLRTFDLKFQGDNIDILNLKWSHYSMIMTCLTEKIQKLKKPISDSYLNDHRKKMVKEYENLYDILLDSDLPTRGIAVSLDDQVLDALGK